MNKTTIILVILFLAIGFLAVRSVKVEDADKSKPGDTNKQQLQITVAPTGSVTGAVESTKEGKMTDYKNPDVKTGNLTAEKKLVTISTSKGNIEAELYPEAAPNTVANFLKKSADGFYNDKTWHRVEDWVIQGGDPLGNGTGGGNMQTELNDLTYVAGSIGIARGQDIRINNDSQFFIVKKDSSFLDKQYTNFGKVTAGMDVVNKIAIGDKILGVKEK